MQGIFAYQRQWRVCLAAFVLLAAGCTQQALHPMSDPAKSVVDKSLIGVWKEVDKQGRPTSDLSQSGKYSIGVIGKGAETEFSKFFQAKFGRRADSKDVPAGLMACSALGLKRGGDLDTENSEVIYFFTAKIDSDSFANLICVADEKGEQGGNQADVNTGDGKSSPEKPQKSNLNQPRFAIIRYDINGTRLRLWDVDRTALTDAIKSAKLKGTLANTYTPALTETTDNLNRFLREGGAKKLFPAGAEPVVIYERIELK